MDEAALVREADAISNRAWSRLFHANPHYTIPEGFRPLPPDEAGPITSVALHDVSAKPTPLIA
jgi:hypothetical protein